MGALRSRDPRTAARTRLLALAALVVLSTAALPSALGREDGVACVALGLALCLALAALARSPRPAAAERAEHAEREQAESELRGQKQLFESLVTVARATAAAGDLETTLQNSLDVASSLTGAQGASIFLLDEQGRLVRAVVSGPDPGQAGRGHAGLLLREGLIGRVARARESALVEDTRLDERWLHFDHNSPLEWRSALAVPISSGSAAVGVITLVHSEPAHFGAGHRRLIEASAAQMALSLRNAQVSEARLQLAREQKLLYAVLEAASRMKDPLEIAGAATAAIAWHTGWAHVVVALPGDDGFWRLPGLWNPPPGFRVPVRGGVLGRAFASGRTQVVADARADPDFVPSSATTRSELAVPLRSGGSTLGVLNLESDAPGAFGPGDVRLAEALAEPIALSLQNARLYADLAAQTARLEAVVRSSRDGLVLVDSQGELLLVSEPALRLLGLPGAPQDWIGRPLERLAARFERRSADAGLRAAALAADERTYEGECPAADGTLAWTSLPVPSVGRLLAFRDVTRERELTHMREDLTHTMVHDLKSPLTAILGSVEWVGQSQALSAEQRTMLAIATANARRQLQLIDSILELNCLEQQQLPLEASTFDLGDLVSEVLLLLGPQAAQRGVALHSDVCAGLLALRADRGLVARVLENLLANALKFTPAGGWARVQASGLEGGDVEVRVSDSGAGVPEALRPRLFQKFAAGTQRGRGSGLGLAFCRLAVEAHGGRLWLASAPRCGAVFAFTLPSAEGRRAAASGGLGWR